MVGNAAPSQDDWRHHRDTIEALWPRMTLKKLRHHMQAGYDFSASERMYEEHFRKWGLHKYSRRTKKHEMHGRFLHDAQTRTVLPNVGIKTDDMQEIPRYLQEMHLTNATDHGNFCGSSKATHTSSSSSGPNHTLTPETSEGDSSHNGEQSARASNRQNLHSELACILRPPLYRMLDHASSESQTLQTILRGVYSCFACPDFDHDSRHPAPDQVSRTGAGTQPLFWDEIKQGIYFLKISDFERAFPVLNKTVELAPSVLTDSPKAFIQELFSTLSPVNTAVCPEVRLSLLRAFAMLAGQKFGSTHCVTIICSELQKDCTSQEISERGLSCIIDLLTSTRGTSHMLTFRSQLALIKLLRRSKNYDRAGAMARRLSSSSINSSGIQSISARLASRELEHILMDQNEWHQALEVCFSIIGQQSSASGTIEPQYHDIYAVHTMEDIAKIYDNLGQSESCIAWLIQAAKSAFVLKAPWMATMHIIDKLVTALRAVGKHEDAKFWQSIHMPDGDGL